MYLNNLILIIFLIIFGLFFYKTFLFILKKYNLKLLLDDQLAKPQAFHFSPTPYSLHHLFFSVGADSFFQVC